MSVRRQVDAGTGGADSRSALLERKSWENRARLERARVSEGVLSLLSLQFVQWTGFSETRELEGPIISPGDHFHAEFDLGEESRRRITDLLRCVSADSSVEPVYVGLSMSRGKTGLFTCTLATAVDHLFDLLDFDGDTVTLIQSGHQWAISVDLVIDERAQVGYRSFYEVQVLGAWAERAKGCA